MNYFLFGFFAGFLVCGLYLKHSIKKKGCGCLSFCSQCPHKISCEQQKNSEVD